MFILNLQRLVQSVSLEINPIDSAVLYYPHDNSSLVWWMFQIKRTKRLSQAPVHFVSARAGLLTDQKMSGLPILTEYTQFNIIREQTSASSPTDSTSSCLNWWSSRQGLDFVQLLHLIVCQFAVSLGTFLRVSFHVMRPSDRLRVNDHAIVFPWDFSQPGDLSVALAEIRDSNIFLYSSLIFSFDLHSHWVRKKYTWSRNDVGSPWSTSFINFFHTRLKFGFLPGLRIRIDLVFDERIGIPKSVPTLIPVPTELFQIFFPTIGQVGDRPYRFRSRRTTGSAIFDRFFWPSVSWKTNPSILTFWLWNCCQPWSALHFDLGVGRSCIGCLSCTIW